MMLSLFLSRVLGIVRDVVMAAQFGIGAETDAYRLAFQVPDLLFFLIAGGALSSAFIPVFSEYLHTGREQEAWRVFSSIVTLVSIVLVVAIGLAWVFAVPLTRWVAPGKGEDLVPLIAHMSRILLPAQFAFFVGGLMFGTLYARHRFVMPGLAPNVYNLGIIAGAVLLSQVTHPGIVGMAWGALIGAVVGNLILPGIAMIRLGSAYQPLVDLRHPGVRKVLRLMMPVVFGLSLPGVYGLVMQWFGSFYAAGVNTALDLANKLMQAPLGIFGQALALAAFPALSQFFAQGREQMYREQLQKTLRTVIFLTVPVTVLFAVFAPEIAFALYLYGRGQLEQVAMVGDCLRLFALGVVAWCLHPVLMRAYFARHDTLRPILIGTLTTFAFVGLALALQATPLGYLGIPLASSLSAILLALAMLGALHRDVGGLDLAGIGETALKALAAALGMTLVLTAGDALLPVGEGIALNVWSLVRVAGLGLAGVWVYVGVARWAKMPETEYVDRALKRRARGTPAPPEP